MEEIERCIRDVEYEANKVAFGRDTFGMENARNRLRNAIEKYALEKEKASLLEIAKAMGLTVPKRFQ